MPENEKDNEGYVEGKLAQTLEEKVQERREFRTIIEQFRYTNTDLYQKMAQAGETRNSALFNKKAKWKLALVLPSKTTSNDNKSNSIQPSKESPILKIKSKSGKGKFIIEYII